MIGVSTDDGVDARMGVEPDSEVPEEGVADGITVVAIGGTTVAAFPQAAAAASKTAAIPKSR